MASARDATKHALLTFSHAYTHAHPAHAVFAMGQKFKNERPTNASIKLNYRAHLLEPIVFKSS